MGTIYPFCWSPPTLSRNIQQNFIFCSHCWCYTEGKPDRKLCYFRKIPALFCPLEGHGVKNSRNLSFQQIFVTTEVKLTVGTRKWIGVKRRTPWGNVSGIKWTEELVFSKSSGNLVERRTGGQRNGQTREGTVGSRSGKYR